MQKGDGPSGAHDAPSASFLAAKARQREMDGEKGVLEWHRAACDVPDFTKYRRPVPKGTWTILAHTRYATQGLPAFIENNHPIRRGPFYVIHPEGLIENWDGETAVMHRDGEGGAWIFICLHSTRRGPAGGGTRMKSRRAKMLHEVGGRSLVGHVAPVPAEWVEVQQAGRPEAVRQEADTHGRFHIPDLVAGPFRLLCRFRPGAPWPVMLTEWVTI